MTRAEILNCLTDRPCDSCKFHESGRCERWNCVFEERPDDCEDAISRQAARKIILDEFEGWPTDEEVAQLKRLTKQIDELPSVNPQEPCEDAISRQAVMNLMRGLTRWGVRSEDGKFNNVGLLYDDVMFGLDRLPSVTPKQRTGHWIKVDDEEPIAYDCSECVAMVGRRCRFCPDCGAEMENAE